MGLACPAGKDRELPVHPGALVRDAWLASAHPPRLRCHQATPATPAMTRVLLEQNNSYASSKKKKNPLAKTHMSDAMELLDTGLEGAAAEQMEQACKLDPVSTGKRLVRVRDQLEETLRETSHASVGPTGARRYSISSADDELIGEPSFVMEAGQLGRKREDIEVYTCPLLRSDLIRF